MTAATGWKRKGVAPVELAPYQVRRFKAMAAEGYEVRQIAESFGRSTGWVSDYTERHGIVLMDERSRTTRSGIAAARAQRQEGARA